jgi:hypothetical protein
MVPGKGFEPLTFGLQNRRMGSGDDVPEALLGNGCGMALSKHDMVASERRN